MVPLCLDAIKFHPVGKFFLYISRFIFAIEPARNVDGRNVEHLKFLNDIFILISMMKNIRHQKLIRFVIAVMVAAGLAVTSVSALHAQPSATTDASGKNVERSKSYAQKTTPELAMPYNTNKTAKFKAECPKAVRCVVIPAAYQGNNPADPVDYGNYDTANRPHDMKIDSVIIHDTEGSLESVLEAFQNPTFYASTHYVIDADGTIYQMVKNKNVAWHAGNWWYNMHSIGIEHVGHAALGHTEYTPAMYKASAALVKWLASKYNIPTDRQHIIGHDNVPATTGAGIPAMHTDPGPFWNWQKHGTLLGAPIIPTASLKSKLVTVAPIWPLNKQLVTGCTPPNGPCVPSDKPLKSNFVYLRTAPSHTAPMISDPVLGQGSTDIENTAARAYYGQKFAVMSYKLEPQTGIWYRIWYAGQPAWFHSPWTAPTAFSTSGKYITPKSGQGSIPVYGRPLPEQSEYPDDFAPPAGAVSYPTPLPYTIPAGQRYSVVKSQLPTDFYFAWTHDSSLPYDHTVFKGSTKYVSIQYNGRIAFVKKADVNIKTR